MAPGSDRPYQLAKVPIKLAGGGNAEVLAYALSPDDSELAVESQQGSQDSGANVTTLAIYSVSSGAELRAWTTGGYTQELGYPDALSWLPGGRQLSFSHIPPGRHDADQDQVRTINVTGHGIDLLAASRVVLTVTDPPSSPSTCWTLNLTPDGGTVICGTQYNESADDRGTDAGCASAGLEFTAYSARTGKPVRVLYKDQGPCSNGGLLSQVRHRRNGNQPRQPRRKAGRPARRDHRRPPPSAQAARERAPDGLPDRRVLASRPRPSESGMLGSCTGRRTGHPDPGRCGGWPVPPASPWRS
jgi:hypothetical protein